MGESLPLLAVELNGALKVEARAERLSGGAGALILREVSERLAIGAVSGGVDFPATFLVPAAGPRNHEGEREGGRRISYACLDRGRRTPRGLPERPHGPPRRG